MSLLILNQTKREFLKIYHYRNFYILSKTKRSETCDLLIRIKKDESKCQNGGIFFQQIRRLQYKNFGHRPTPPHIISTVWYMIVGGGMFLSIFWDLPIMLFKSVKKYVKGPSVEAASLNETNQDAGHSEIEEQNGNDLKLSNKKSKIGFRERKIIEYENRIRHYSTPDKVFRYFASLQVVQSHGEAEIYMTPDDFLRSITPGMKQPDGLGLDQFRRYDPKTMTQLLSFNDFQVMTEQLIDELGLREDSVFLKLGSSGLISFSDYIFLLTLLSTSSRHFEVAFRMFDFNGDGDVDAEEFDQVATLLRQNTTHGSRHRDTTGNSYKGVNSALSAYFFGPNRDQKLTIDKFLEFQKQLKEEILTLEFSRKGLREDAKLSEVDFAEMLLAYAGYPDKRKIRMIKRVRKGYQGEKSIGISLKDYLDFFHFLNSINDVDTALTFYHIAGASIEPTTLKHVARTVAHVELIDHVVEVVFTIFDENQDGQLSNREFIAVMKNRMMRGLEKPKDTGFIKLIESSLKCAKQTRPALLDF
ncbi:calcium uptake protein 1 homolog, mitochondrial-like isoform X1 [Daphnia pulicaria]|uniref:calcium uptake protein 1 homolog, mitochondrial-like isoform X1 n=1 Tax=Daphnia pulicaria TaxID=35523 RepID=UPI001EEB5187|nr:calcium uptake protein 1 homolog, mitochondrial-like isoform X1 [Daphnia pulicaria]